MYRKIRTRQRRRIARPSSGRTFFALVSGVVEVGIFFITLALQANGVTGPIKATAALGTICIFLAVYNIIMSLMEMGKKEYDLVWKIVALALSFFTFFLWVSVYFVGFTSVSN